MSEKHYNGNQGEVAKRRDTLTPANPLTPQGALALALPVGPGVVQSLAYHPHGALPADCHWGQHPVLAGKRPTRLKGAPG